MTTSAPDLDAHDASPGSRRASWRSVRLGLGVERVKVLLRAAWHRLFAASEGLLRFARRNAAQTLKRQID
jgi:hypothetical protein